MQRHNCFRLCYTLVVYALPLAATTSSVAQHLGTAQALHPFCDNGRWGYVDVNGRETVEPQYTKACDFSDGRALVIEAGRFKYIGTDGAAAIVLPIGADAARPFAEGVAWFRAGGRYGLVAADGQNLINPRFRKVTEFSEGRASVVMSEDDVHHGRDPQQWTYVDTEGAQVISELFTSASPFADCIARVTLKESSQWAYIAHNGEVVFSASSMVLPKGAWVRSSFNSVDGYVLLHVDGRGTSFPYSCFVNGRGENLWNARFASANPFSNGRAAVVVNGKCGFVDGDGRVVIPPKYDTVGAFNEGWCPVCANGTWYFIDKRGVAMPGSEGLRLNDAESFRGGLARVHVGGDLEENPVGRTWAGGAWHYLNRKGSLVSLCRADGEYGSLFGREMRRSDDD